MKEITSKVKADNIDSVELGDLVIETTLNTGFDSDTPKELKRDVTLRFYNFGSEEVKLQAIDRLAAALRITANGDSGPLKPLAYDSESYVKMLEQNDLEFEFDVAELLKPKKQAEKDPRSVVFGLVKAGHITQEQALDMLAAGGLDD